MIRAGTTSPAGPRNWPTAYGTAGAAETPETDHPAPGSVPVTTIILARNEAVNIVRAVRSASWCRQTIVVDSGSTDGTPALARAEGAEVVTELWRGYAGQREWAMRHPAVAHDWVLFLDADEWIPTDLAAQIADRVGGSEHAAFSMRRRLAFAGRWIAHCGWYTNSWQARLLHRERCSFDTTVAYGERATVLGSVGRLSADLIDEDSKGIPAWLRKHVGYAELEAHRRDGPRPWRRLPRILRESRRSSRPLGRTLAKEIIFPLVPAKPALLFLYMYVLRAGWRDGRAGLVFCLYHAWYELTVGVLRTMPSGSTVPGTAVATGIAVGRSVATAGTAPDATSPAPAALIPGQRRDTERLAGSAGVDPAAPARGSAPR
ncbi:glycosyl transferase [Parafrankia soli]|uniref:Glycosyl transferase n=1 Tax=Parafrankia soli TaxID=2599596 RepID=A0A1S1PB62_9ACTN|nr:glycosyltransferase family 2 protein [Parafrankia soli]OHV20143.1 glycosyl transferase [Parafrankia soli]